MSVTLVRVILFTFWGVLISWNTFALQSENIDASLNKEHALVVRENKFVVDNQARSILALIMTNNAATIEIIAPTGKTWKFDTVSDQVTWQKIENLYAVEIKNPESGQWQINGKLLQNPEVLVRSDLKMNTPNLPNNMIRGETLALRASLSEQDKAINQGSLLANTSVMATMQNMATNEKFQMMLNPSKRGLFEYRIKLDQLPGIYQVVLTASGLMFQRERKQQFFLHDYPASIQTEIDGNRDVLTMYVKLTSDLLERATTEVAAVFTNAKGQELTQLLNQNEAGEWFLIYNLTKEIDKMHIVLTGFLKDSRQVHVIFPIINVSQMLFNAHQAIKQQIQQNSDQFWQAMFDQALMAALPYTPDKIRNQLLTQTPIAAFAEPSRYPSFVQEVLQSYNEPINAVKRDIASAKAKTKTKVQMETRTVTKTVPHPLKRYRIWLITIFSIFTLLFIGLLIGLMMQFIKARKNPMAKETMPEKEKEVTHSQAVTTDEGLLEGNLASAAAPQPTPPKAPPESPVPEEPESPPPEKPKPEMPKPEKPEPEIPTLEIEPIPEKEPPPQGPPEVPKPEPHQPEVPPEEAPTPEPTPVETPAPDMPSPQMPPPKAKAPGPESRAGL